MDGSDLISDEEIGNIILIIPYDINLLYQSLHLYYIVFSQFSI